MNKKQWRNYRRWLVSMVALVLTVSCSNEPLRHSVANDSVYGPAEVEVVCDPNSMTRALNSTLKSFTLSIVDEYYEEEGAVAEDVQETKNEDTGKWTAKPIFYLLDSPQNAYAIAPSTSLPGMSNASVTYDSQTFDYTVPTTNQSSVKIASRLNFTRKAVNNKLSLTFRDVLFGLQIQAVNEIKDVTIKVASITIHNALPTGTFSFDKKKESRGKWTVNYNRNTCVSYSQTLKNPVELSRTNYRNIVDSTFTLLPQDLYDGLWFPMDNTLGETGEELSDAIANHHMFLEVKCQIIQHDGNDVIYLWGYPEDGPNTPEYESVYFPYDEEACLSDWEMGMNSVYFLEFNTITGGYDKDGGHITPHPTTKENAFTQFQNAEPVKFNIGTNGNVDPWIESGNDYDHMVTDGWTGQIN